MTKALPALLLLACVAQARAYRHIYVPNQPESAKCWRECKLVEATCNNRPPPPRSAGWNNLEDVCEEQRKDCLLSCPGATVEWRDAEGRRVNASGSPLGPRRGEPNDDGS
jgi:hypothetical protein